MSSQALGIFQIVPSLPPFKIAQALVCAYDVPIFFNLKFQDTVDRTSTALRLTSFQVSVMLIVIVKIPESATYCLAILMLQFQCTSLLETE